MEQICTAWKANVSIAFWVRKTSGLDISMLQLWRLRFSHFCITVNVFFPKARREKNSYFLSSHPPLFFWVTAPTSALCLLLIAYCLGYSYVFRSASSQRHTLFGIPSGRCSAPQQAHTESLPGNFNSALLRAVVFSIQACVSLVLVSCIRVNFPWEK